MSSVGPAAPGVASETDERKNNCLRGGRKLSRLTIKRALDSLKGGDPVVLTCERDETTMGYLVLAAARATSRTLALQTRHGSGRVAVAIERGRLKRLRLPIVIPPDGAHLESSSEYLVSVGVKNCRSNGTPTDESLATVLALANPDTRPEDLRIPGPVLPCATNGNGVLDATDVTAAAVELMRLAELVPVAAVAPLVNQDGETQRGEELADFARTHGLLSLSLRDLVVYRNHYDGALIKRVGANLPTSFGIFTTVVFQDSTTGADSIALVTGSVDDGRPVLTRVHSECLTGDVLGSLRCDCGPQLHAALARIAQEGRGVLLYLRQEGRGIGLFNKIRTYALQDQGLDTVEANERLGFAADLRDYSLGAKILKELGMSKIKLLTNNPRKIDGFQRHGLQVVSRVPLIVPANPENQYYLTTKREKLGHLLTLEEKLIVSET